MQPIVLKATSQTGNDSDLKFVLSTEHVDLVGDIVVQSGITLARTPLPAQIDHGGSMRDLIGAWHDVTTEGKKTVARLELLPAGVTPAADLVRAINAAGIRMAASVGFRPVKWEPIRAKDDRGGERITGFKITESILTEASIIVTPANPHALQVAKGLGIKLSAVDLQAQSSQWQDRQRIILRAQAAAERAAKSITTPITRK